MRAGEKSPLVRIGDFFFKWRNLVFPVVVLALVLAFPPGAGIFGANFSDRATAMLGLTVIASGLGLRFATIGWAYIIRGGRNKLVYAEGLVTTGYFATCRNPLYLGNILIYIGLFLTHGNPWLVALGAALFIFIYGSIVAAEEWFLQRKFGSAFKTYCAKVDRWLPDFRKLKTGCAGMRFSTSRSILMDYPTIGSTGLSVLIVFALQASQTMSMGDGQTAAIALATATAGLAAFVLAVKLTKTRLKPRG